MGNEPRSGVAQLKIMGVALLVAAVSAPLHALALHFDAPEPPIRLDWWSMALGFAITEMLVTHVHFRRQRQSVSISELPLALGLAMATPTGLIVGRLLGAGAALALHRRQPSYRLAFNLSLFFLETTVALVVYRGLIGGRSPGSTAGLGIVLLALGAALVVTTMLVVTARSINDALRPRHVLLSMTPSLVISSIISMVAVVGLAITWQEPWALAATGGGGLLLYLAIRAYATLSKKLQDLEAIYAFTTSVDQDSDTDELVETTLALSRDLLRADFGEVVMSRGVGSVAMCLRDDRPLETRPASPPVLKVMGEMEGDGEGGTTEVFLLGDAPDAIVEHYRDHGVLDGMVAKLSGGANTGALFVVGNRSGPERFGSSDLQLFNAVARQVRAELERARLVERLRREAQQKEHQALHDALTALPNRLHFTIVIEDALRRARDTDGRVAVLLIDLDRFKEVNDTLGHQLGDTLLQEMALRLSEVAGGDDLLARLGGDEFGVVVRGVGGVSDAVAWAKRIGDALHRPFMHEGLAIQVSGSIGIALAPDHGMDGVTLLRRADVAMYEAKASGSSFEVYEPQRDTYSTRRLAMAAELRGALEAGDIQVHYQPKAWLGDGTLIGVEALARWAHPRHGNVPPNEFVELAERTGLIRPLTEHVLRTALRDQKRIRWEHKPVGVSINIAANSLEDDDFPSTVARMLSEFDAQPQSLTLEVTETTMMTDSARARLALSQLDEMGLQLSIDDFGTGYSSLAYLSSLPVDEVKIDRSFVMGMAVDERLAKIVTSTTTLVHSLDLRVVAEGVENRATWELLSAAGCDVAQGYYLAMPMPLDRLLVWIAEGAEPVGPADIVSPLQMNRPGE